MKKIAIITGGAGGMGLATASILGQDHAVLICDIHQPRLDHAVQVLRQQGVDCEAAICDVTSRESVLALFERASSLGEVVSVVHTSGISPQMASAEVIMRVNALGTIHITDAAYSVASDAFALVNVASMAAYMAPGWIAPKRAFAHAFTDPELFLKKALWPCRLVPSDFYRKGLAYVISKQFVIWCSRKNAARFGEKKARILSVSPGTFDTEMGRTEEKSGSMDLLKNAALKRPGRPEEIAQLLAFCASDKAGYLTGVDVLCDGGVVASRT